MRLLIPSDAADSMSGYACQVRQFAPALVELGHDVALLATFGHHGAIREWRPKHWPADRSIRVYPGGADSFANDVIAHYARDWKADIVITLKDSFVFRPEAMQGLRWCVPGHTLITLANGQEVPIEEIVSRTYKAKVKAWDGQKTVAADILEYQCIQTGMSGEIVGIETEGGETLELTAENQVLVLRNGTIDWVEAGCVIPGDVVYCNDRIPHTERNNYGSDKGMFGKSRRTDERTYTHFSDSRMGIRSRNTGWRRDDIHHQVSQAETLGAQTTCVCNKHERGTNDVVGSENWNEGQQPIPAGATPLDEERPESLLCCDDHRLSRLPHSEEHRAIPDRKKGTGAGSDAVHGEPSGATIQRAIYSRRTGLVAPCEGFEPRRVSSVQRRGRPYSVVYDITTTAGNFVAGDILIHNCPMVPCDHEPLPPAVANVVRASYRPIAYAPNGFRELRKAGFDPLYCPHSFDPKIFHPEDKSAARKFLGLPEDTFIIGTVAVNRGGIPSRKAWPQNLEAFALFAKDKPDVRYFLHTDLAGDGYEGGVSLQHLAAQLGIADKIIFCDQERYRKGGFPDEYLLAFYNSIDVLNAVSLGEGFGIPQLESQACGTPVITSDFAASRDLCFGGWGVSWGLKFYDGQSAWTFIPHPKGVALAMGKAYQALRRGNTKWGAPEGLRAAAIEGAAQYELSHVIQAYWKPALEELEEQIKGEIYGRGVLRIIRPEEVLA